VGAIKRQLAFYGSTPAYAPVLELHGWGDLQPELHALSLAGKWVEMGELITDDILNAFAVIAAPKQLGSALADRCRGVVDRVSFAGLGGTTETSAGILAEAAAHLRAL
jgi:hypothetical protein